MDQGQKWQFITKYLEALTMYVIPLSVPASYGYKSTVRFSIHVQFFKQRFNPFTPTTQSGVGPKQ